MNKILLTTLILFSLSLGSAISSIPNPNPYENITCVDSDNGINGSIFGQVFRYDSFLNTSELLLNDTCSDNMTLVESYCEIRPATMPITCEYGCDLGACLPKPEEPVTETPKKHHSSSKKKVIVEEPKVCEEWTECSDNHQTCLTNTSEVQYCVMPVEKPTITAENLHANPDLITTEPEQTGVGVDVPEEPKSKVWMFWLIAIIVIILVMIFFIIAQKN